jgi:hypothetical protein
MVPGERNRPLGNAPLGHQVPGMKREAHGVLLGKLPFGAVGGDLSRGESQSLRRPLPQLTNQELAPSRSQFATLKTWEPEWLESQQIIR